MSKRGKTKTREGVAPTASPPGWWEVWQFLTVTEGEYVKFFDGKHGLRLCQIFAQKLIGERKEKYPSSYIRVEIRRINIVYSIEQKTKS